MAPRAIATASISFGLVSIPVRLFPATSPGSTISFHTLHGECGTRIRQQLFCPKCEKTIARDETVKGYEFTKDQYVTFQPEEIRALEQESSKSIDISEFVPEGTIDPVFFDGSYYLGPDKGADRPYRLLAEAMRRTGRIAISSHSIRGKQYLVALRATEDGLVMHQLRYADEIRSFEEIEIAKGEVKPAELELAVQLIEQIASEAFQAEQYRDEVKDRMREAIERKVEGKEITVAPAERPTAQIIDLMEALEASLGKKAAATAAKSRKGPKRAAAAKKTSAKRSKRAASKK